MPSIDTSILDSLSSYKLLIGTVQPRPIAFVSSIDRHGRSNLAPFSFFNVASSNPPILLFAPQMAPDGDGLASRPKHTLENVRDTGECVIHIVSFSMREKMNVTAAPWPRDISEFDAAGWTPIPSERVAPYRVAEAPVAFECSVDQIISFGDEPRSGSLVLARVLLAHIADEIYINGRIDQQALDTMGRMGGPFYTRSLPGMFELPPPGPEFVAERLKEKQ